MWRQRLLSIIISRYFVDLASVLILYDSSTFGDNTEFYLKATETSFRNLTRNGHPVALSWGNLAFIENQPDLEEFLLKHADNGIQGFITVHLDVGDFLKARFYATRHSKRRLNDRLYLFIVADGSVEEILSEDLLKLYPTHLLVSPVKNESALDLWTQQFVGVEGNANPVHLDRFFSNETFAKDVDLYPDKFHNLEGRNVNVSSVTFSPYFISYNVSDSSGSVDSIDPTRPRKSVVYEGTQADLIITFCQLRNCTIKALPLGLHNWQYIADSIYHQETELNLGYYINWPDNTYDASTTISKTSSMILGPGPSRYPTSMAIILPFSALIWSILILSVLMSSIVFYLIRYTPYFLGHKSTDGLTRTTIYEQSLFQVFMIFCQQSISLSNFNRFTNRFFLASLLLAGLTLENIYSGQLKSVLTIPVFTEPVDTVKKFAATDWKLAAPSVFWVKPLETSDVPYEQAIFKRFVALSDEKLKNVTYLGNHGIIVDRLHGGTHVFEDCLKDSNLDGMILVKDELKYDWIVVLSIRGWPLMNTFNEFIRSCLEHGLYEYWEKRSVLLHKDRMVQEKIRMIGLGRLPKQPPTPFTLESVSGALYLLAVGYCLSLVVFCAEILWKKFTTVPQRRVRAVRKAFYEQKERARRRFAGNKNHRERRLAWQPESLIK